jgi:hypothetical protein
MDARETRKEGQKRRWKAAAMAEGRKKGEMECW